MVLGEVWIAEIFAFFIAFVYLPGLLDILEGRSGLADPGSRAERPIQQYRGHLRVQSVSAI